MIRTLKALYITTLIVIVILMTLLVVSFIFLEKTAHKEYIYDVRINDKLVGNIKIDRFATEDRFIYKSASSFPFNPLFVESKIKMVLNKKYCLESYTDESTTSEGITAVKSMEANDGHISFLSRFQSDVLYISDMPIRKDTFVFKEDSPITYMPVIENYDFRKGRSQGFYALTAFSPFLPPVRRYVTFTSIRDEYLKIDGRKIKAENLILKIKNYPQCSVWVAKSDRKLLMIELPAINGRITRSFRKKPMEVKEPLKAAGKLRTKEVTFSNNTVQLAGTMTMPEPDGRYPAILLLPGKGPYKRDYAGFYEHIANYFAKNGFCALRFDKRGTGKSSGDAKWPTADDAAGDAVSALQFLANQPEVESKNISVLTHGEGASIAARAYNVNKNIRSLVFMAPILYSITDYDKQRALLNAPAEKSGWNESYRSLVLQASIDTISRARNSKLNWAYILGKRCYMGEMKNALDRDPLDPIRKISVPVLTVQGRDDAETILETAAGIDNALKSAGNTNSSILYYGYLGHFFGNPIIDGISPIRYEASTEVLYAILNWIRNNLAIEEPQTIKPVLSPDDPSGKI